MIVRRLKPLPVEAVVRGYLAGSGWKDYPALAARSAATRCPKDSNRPRSSRRRSSRPPPRRPSAITTRTSTSTPSCRSSGATRPRTCGASPSPCTATRARHAAARGIVIADSKFEFGHDAAGNLVIMDEILTPDSSRFWDGDAWRPGSSPPSFDKQYVRDWLETLGWDKTAPGPEIPDEVVAGTLARYEEARRRITGT